MTRITVVIEGHAEGIHIGQQLAGGRVVAAMPGDYSDLLEALKNLDRVVLMSVDGASARRKAHELAHSAIAKARGN